MRILIISPTQSGIGGVSQQVQALYNFLRTKNHIVDIMSSDNTFTIPVKGLKNPSFMVSSFFKSKFGKKYDIIHAQNPPSALAMKNFSGKKILSLWGVYPDQIRLLHGNVIGKISQKLERKALEWADAIIVYSKEIQKHYTKLGYRIHYIPNGIDLNSLPKTENRLYKKQIIYVGRLSKEKGISDLIKMSEDLPNEIHFIILGSGPEEDRIKDLVKKKPNIHYLGYQPKEKTIPFIRGSDILIQPSLMEGGINTTLLEAMACRTSIISTSLEVNKETIRHKDTAFCVKPNAPNEILDGILILYSDEQLKNQLIENAFKTVQDFSWEKIGEKYLQVYQSFDKS